MKGLDLANHEKENHIAAIHRISCGLDCVRENACVIELDDRTVRRLSSREWYQVISAGLRSCGYVEKQRICSVVAQPCELK